MLHRQQAFEDFSYLWQVAKGPNQNLLSLQALGIDDDNARYDAIL